MLCRGEEARKEREEIGKKAILIYFTTLLRQGLAWQTFNMEENGTET
jgi:hypothetical protein